jgi:hypothetical protein
MSPRHCFSILVLLLATACSERQQPVVGVKIYEYDGDYNTLVDQWKHMGINSAFLSAVLAGDSAFRQLLSGAGIGTFLIFPVFQNPEYLRAHPDARAIRQDGAPAVDDWVEFVCPSNALYRKQRRDELSVLLKSLKPDGLSIDFIRHFVFWEMVYPDRDPATIDMACFCPACLAAFGEESGIAVPDTCSGTASRAAFLTGHHSEAWNEFRSGLIAGMAEELARGARSVDPGIRIALHAVPWRKGDFDRAGHRIAGQDIARLGTMVDLISPMCYSQMLRREPEWIAAVVADMEAQAPGKILPSIQVFLYYVDDPFPVSRFTECLRAALRPPSRGVVFFSWPLFERDPERMEAVRNVMKRPTQPQ